jgi:hypothetical protein
VCFFFEVARAFSSQVKMRHVRLQRPDPKDANDKRYEISIRKPYGEVPISP